MREVIVTTLEICISAVVLAIVCRSIGAHMDKKTQKSGDFADRHPYLNMIIVLEMIIFAGAICFIPIYYIGCKIKEVIIWIADMASKMDAVVIVALITGSVSIIGVIISSIFSKIIEYRKSRQDYLAKKREVPYGEFVEMIYKMQSNIKNNGSYTEEMMVEDLSKFSKQITLWGSPRVVNKWVRFREEGTNPGAAVDNLFLMEEIMNEMRKDLGMRKVKKGNLLAFFVNDIKKILDR